MGTEGKLLLRHADDLVTTLFRLTHNHSGVEKVTKGADWESTMFTLSHHVVIAQKIASEVDVHNDKESSQDWRARSGRGQPSYAVDETQKELHGKAPVNVNCVRVMTTDSRCRSWAQRKSQGVVGDAEPSAVTQYLMADKGSKEEMQGNFSFEMTAAVGNSERERALNGDKVLDLRMGSHANPKLVRKFKAPISSLCFGNMSSLHEFTDEYTIKDDWGNKHKIAGMTTIGVIDLILELCQCMWPEFDWTCWSATASAMRRLHDTKSHTLILRSADLFKEAKFKIQTAVDRVRMSKCSDTLEPLFTKSEFTDWIREEVETLIKNGRVSELANAELDARLSKIEAASKHSSSTSSNTGTVIDKRVCKDMDFATAKPEFLSKHQGKCFHINYVGVCKPPEGRTCSLDHKVLPDEERKAFCSKHGGTWLAAEK